MNAKTASIAAGVAGTLLFGTFLAHNQSFDLQRKKVPEVAMQAYSDSLKENKKDEKDEKALKKNIPVVVAMTNATTQPSPMQVQQPADTQPQQPSTTPPPAANNKKASKTRAS